jgi:hypothetical protein
LTPGCALGPDARFWGYDAVYFARCFDGVAPPLTDTYQSVLSAADRAFAVALGAALVLWSARLRVWTGAVAGFFRPCPISVKAYI